MEFHANIHANIEHCSDCNDVLTDNDRSVKGRCRHCTVKRKYGVVDINNCFQGSVIIMED
jgi:hypothetical protein